MIATLKVVGAPPIKMMDWHSINWRRSYRIVERLQARIVKATQARRWGKVKALQRLLTHSFSGKAIAVKRVTENKGKKTAGVDGGTWSTPECKRRAIEKLKKRGYKPLPLKPLYIPKVNGKKRPLGIPAIKDRAMQALYKLALEPMAETIADKHSYGFRPKRSTADAIEQCFAVLSLKRSAAWILEADIEGCFDYISHDWLLDNVPMDKGILKKWLKAGFMEKHTLYPTEAGAPQGGVLSPLLANIALEGLGKLLEKVFPMKRSSRLKTFKVNYVRYCDDFIITGSSKELLEEEVKPLVEAFLATRGLKLSQEKTKITHINEGVNFLGQNIRKYNGKLLIKPSKENVKAFLNKVRTLTRNHRMVPQVRMIALLNPLIRGWVTYHRHVVSKQTFTNVRHQLWKTLWRWARFRHPNKAADWVKKKYFITRSNVEWMFGFYEKDERKAGLRKAICLEDPSRMPIRRHIKVKAEANPYDPSWKAYFEARLKRKMQESLARKKKLLALWRYQGGICPLCNQPIEEERGWHRHHLQRRIKGGDDNLANLILVHPNCHRQIHCQKLLVVKPAFEEGLTNGLSRMTRKCQVRFLGDGEDGNTFSVTRL